MAGGWRRPAPFRLARGAYPRAREGGSSVVEAVVVIPVVVFLTLIIVQSVLAWHARHVAQDAARQGVQVARGFGAADADGRTRTLTYLEQVAPRLVADPNVEVTRTATTLSVTVHARVLGVLPWPGRDIEERSEGVLERFVTAN